jgi:ABC-type sugar transport system ATPase subunit
MARNIGVFSRQRAAGVVHDDHNANHRIITRLFLFLVTSRASRITDRTTSPSFWKTAPNASSNRNTLTTSPRYYEQSVLIKLAVTLILQGLSGVVGALLKAKDEMNRLVHIQDTLELNHILDRNISDLSGGELQRFAIGIIRSVMLAQPVFLAITSLSLQRAEGRRVHVRRAFFLPRCQAAPQSQVSSSIFLFFPH